MAKTNINAVSLVGEFAVRSQLALRGYDANMTLGHTKADNLEKLLADQGGRLTLEKGDDPKDLRRALKAAASSLNRPDPVPVPRRGRESELLP
jgi:hypothetical protein